MNSSWMALLCFISCAAVSQAQAPGTRSRVLHSHPDFSREPFVIEQYATTARFENDGTEEEDLRVRIGVQNDSGVAAWRELVFGYDDKRERIDVRYVRIRKADGNTNEIPTDAIKDTVAAAAHEFPAYANCKEKDIAVPSLAPGDTLEYEIAKRVIAPAAPNEFWFEHSFIETAVVLDERLEINIPARRKVVLKSSDVLAHEATEIGGRTIYSWKHANFKHGDETSQQTLEQLKKKTPDVQLTSFGTWDEVARWYSSLAQGRDEPTPEIRAKTRDLVQGRLDGDDKIEALYDYVSKKIRYVALPFGAAGYQPHRAAEILSNQYGNAQDKHTLLAAMLRAMGMSAEAALMPSARQLDSSVASPAQFDRVITAAPSGGGALIWMDSTLDIAPYRMLAAGLRKRSSLLISEDAKSKIVETPPDPPFVSAQRVDIEGQVSELGKLTAHARYSVRGDAELVLRAAFHRSREEEWKEIGQTILTQDGIHGEVTSVKSSDSTATHDAFEIDLDFAQSNFTDWLGKSTRTSLPLPAIGLPDPPHDKTRPIDLGSPLSVLVKLKLVFPAAFTARPPTALALRLDFAEFTSSYQFVAHTLTAERTLDFTMRELPPSRAAEYAAFIHAVTTDENQPLAVENAAPGAIPRNATVDQLVEAGRASFHSGNSQAAIPLFERVVQLDPQHKQAWNDLGLVYLNVGKLDEAIAAFQSQLEANPSDERANQYLGLAHERKQNYSQAAAAFRRQTQINPLDPVAHGSLGEVLLEQHEYAQALPEFEKATVLAPQNAQLQIGLGRAYAETGKNDEAVAAFERAAALSPSAEILNEIAFNLAEVKLALDKAQRYAESAIADAGEALRPVELDHVSRQNLVEIENIAAYWDTLGWVFFQRNYLDRAAKYIRAAWLLSQDGEAGDHLAQIYERLGQKDRAIHACALALAAPHATPDTRARLTLLLRGNRQIDELVAKAKPELQALRAIPVGNLLAEDARADFLILLSPGVKQARVDAMTFIGGDERLRPFADRLRSLDYGLVFPDSSPAKLIRRGTLACSKTDACTFTLMLPESVGSAD